jgi:hypothetical protein
METNVTCVQCLPGLLEPARGAEDAGGVVRYRRPGRVADIWGPPRGHFCVGHTLPYNWCQLFFKMSIFMAHTLQYDLGLC